MRLDQFAGHQVDVQRRSHDLFETALDGYLVTDPDGNIWETNHTAAEMLRINESAAVGKPLMLLIAEQDRPAWRAELNRLKRGDRVNGFELSISPHEGPSFPALLKPDAIRDADGRLIAFRWMMRDISRRKQAEDALARSNALLTSLGRVVARLQATLDPAHVMETLGTELRNLQLDCFIGLQDPATGVLTVRYFSVESAILARVEKLIGVRILGFQIPPERFAVYDSVAIQQQPTYIADWHSVIAPLVPAVPKPILQKAGKLIGATSNTHVAYLPLSVEARVLGVLGIWGENLCEQDLAPLSIFAGHVALALHNAHLFDELERQRAQLQSLSARLVTLLEDERRRIARELHDEAGQLLYGLRLQLDVLARQIPPNQYELCAQTETIRELLDEARERIRLLSHQLRPATLDELGLVPALQQLLAGLDQAGLATVFDAAELCGRMAAPLETACYRIVQEALTNIVRHADAHQVVIALQCDDGHVSLNILDDGKGFDFSETHAGGMGLLGIKERVAGLGGEVCIHSERGKGTQLQVRLPFPTTEVQ